MITVTQLSDTHFGPDGHRSHSGLGYDTDVAFDTVVDHIVAETGTPDLFVVTGDLADQGHPVEYAKARDALARLPGPVNLVAGNHDFQVPFEVGLGSPGVTMSRTMRLGSWLFVFADSNFSGRDAGPGGRLVDRESRMHEANGMLGAAEVSWMHDVIEAGDAEHVFIWLHHPPQVPVGSFSVPEFNAEIDELLGAHDRIRGLGAGHVHTAAVIDVLDRPIFVCPALTINIDFEAETLLPPGYRTYRFADDGTIDGSCHLMDGEVWPRHPVPRAGMRFLRGEIGWDEMMAGLGGASPSNPQGA